MMRKIDTSENENEKVLIAFENIFFSETYKLSCLAHSVTIVFSMSIAYALDSACFVSYLF